MTIPLPSAMERATVTWALGHADTTGPLDGARGRVRFEATAVAVAYSDRTVLPKPVETPIIAGVMTPVDLIVNDPDIWNWKVQVRVGAAWEPFHINVEPGGTNLASAAPTPGKGPVRVLKGDRGEQGEQGERGPEGPYGGTEVTDPQVASYMTSATATRAALNAGWLARNLSSPTEISYGASKTSIHARGITLRGPMQDDATENQQDNGTRLTIHSSHGARNSNYGEGLRMVVDTERSKNMIAWYDGFSEPGKIRPKAWIGYHHGTYPDVVHDHISIETPNAVGALYTRFGIGTKNAEVTPINFNMSDVQHTASQGGAFRLAVGGGMQTTHPRDLIFATGTSHSYTERRWALRADNTAEGADNTGSTLRIMRYDNGGNNTPGTTFAIERQRGHVGVGAEPHASWRLNIESGDRAALRLATNASTSSGLLRLEGSGPTGAAIDTRVTGDTNSRFGFDVAGRLEWGPGNAVYDVNVRRTPIGTSPGLATNSDLYFDTIGKGPILRTPNGTLRRVRVNDDGSLYTTAV